MTLHQVHRLVQLALGAMAVGFAALAGTEVAFGRRKFGADEGLNHILYHTLYKIRMESKRKNAIRICPSLGSGLKHQWNQMIWSARELGCGIAGVTGQVCFLPSSFHQFQTECGHLARSVRRSPPQPTYPKSASSQSGDGIDPS